MIPLKQKLEIAQGRTFSQSVRWEATPFIYVPIAAITKAAPVEITTQVPHNIPTGWRCAVVSVLGMTEINAKNDPPAPSDFRRVTIVDSTKVQFNEVNSALFSTYVSGGYLQFYTPVDLTGFTARMSIKSGIGGTQLLSLTTENGRIQIDAVNRLITLTLSATDTAGLTWRTGTYDLELVGPGGEVVALLKGAVSVTAEVTT